MYRKAFALMALLVVAGLVLTACAPQTVTVTVPVKETVQVPVEKTVVVPQERVTVRLSGWAANPQETALLESLLYRFSVENPDIVVKYEPITGDYWQAIKTLVGAGEEPDIYYMDIFQFPFFAKEGVLLPLDNLMASTGTSRDVFIPDLINAFTYEGKTYGIPKDFNTLALFYNKDLFDQAGLAYPTDDWTWDDLKAAAQKLSQPDKNIYGLGVPADPGRFPIFVFQNGGRIMTEDFSDTLLDSPEVVEAARFYTGFYFDKSGALPTDVGENWQGTAFGKGNLLQSLQPTEVGGPEPVHPGAAGPGLPAARPSQHPEIRRRGGADPDGHFPHHRLRPGPEHPLPPLFPDGLLRPLGHVVGGHFADFHLAIQQSRHHQPDFRPQD